MIPFIFYEDLLHVASSQLWEFVLIFYFGFMLSCCLGDFIQPENCETSNSGGDIFQMSGKVNKTGRFWDLNW